MNFDTDSVYKLFMSTIEGPVLISYSKDTSIQRARQVTFHEGLTDEDEGVRRMASHLHLNRKNYGEEDIES